MSQETKKVLEMLASGQITADDAEKLLDKLGATEMAPARLLLRRERQQQRATPSAGGGRGAL